MVFFDFTKDFDSIKLDKLWSKLEMTTINKNYINVQFVYDYCQAAIKTYLVIAISFSAKVLNKMICHWLFSFVVQYQL